MLLIFSCLHLSTLFTGRTSRCSGCKIPRSEHSFGKPGNNCPGPARDCNYSSEGHVEDTAPSSETTPVEGLSVQDTLASLLGAVKDLITGLNEVKADNQHLRALIAKNSTNDDHEVVEATPGATASSVTLPELRSTKDLCVKADRRVAQMRLVDSSESSGDSDHDDFEASSHVRPHEKTTASKIWKRGQNYDYRPILTVMTA